MFQKLVNLRHLNIEGAYRLEGMPVQIGKLTCLQTLSNLFVGKDNCSGLKELGPLKHLQGTLRISRLENVMEADDAKDAELIKKTKISALFLEWSRDNIDESKDSTSELEVLNGLRPQNDLVELVLRYYGGTTLPNWLTPPSFPRMVSLTLENCYKCTSLPPMGQYLPSLKNLRIGGMANVESVGSELCGGNLETLDFYDMEEWENWSPCEELPNLRELSLIGCPKLLGKLPNNLPLLNKAMIYNCELLACGGKVTFKEGVCVRKFTFEGGVMRVRKVIFISFPLISYQLTRRVDQGLKMEGLVESEKLTINRCEELTNLWSDNEGSLPQLPFLKALCIYNCSKLVSLLAEEVDKKHLQLGIPSRIMSIRIHNCIALESLPKAMM
ncbi:putative disease resistance RPP13-like protein 1 [Carya illinoinensis]|uniref:putative disease resistance RPP13-like protein 1 n=1 Tax=Carya illinoinensis TaxID=32201 RepID=UPI001C719AF5|nr:putative disease resistance RPP13-like protein 1 [Carya illinoinensis]